MKEKYFEDKIFEKIDYSKNGFIAGAYEGCKFILCNFMGADLSNTRFIDCEFNECNLSNVNLTKTTLNNIQFNNCKALGINFECCHEFLFACRFQGCAMDYCNFFKRSLKHSSFHHCSLVEVDFVESDMSGIVLEECDLLKAKFENTILEKADLRTSRNYSLDPELNRIKQAKFSITGIVGLLEKYRIIIE